MIIESSAPTRVDLAGGTIDIWPLYLFHPGAVTVNFGISLRASCRIETRDDERIILESRDRSVTVETSLARFDELKTEPSLELVSKLVHFFKPGVGFHLTTSADAPAGAGLGGSSALAVALIGALNKLTGGRYEERKFIQIVANIETQVIRVPAGFQDYYGAFYGNANCIHFKVDGIRREAIPVDADELERRIVVCYTGEPRMSGINNWEMFKRHIDGDAETFQIFDAIRDTALKMRDALAAHDWSKVGSLMREAYPNRRKLAPHITTPHMEHLVEQAMRNGAEGAKVCGAGGGGCIAFLCSEGAKESVEKTLRDEGGDVLEWKFAHEGLTVK